MFAQSVIKDQERIILRPADLLGLLEQILEPTIIDTILG
jgi:hypothetical protein